MIHYKKICWRRSSDSAAVMIQTLNFLYYIVKNTGLLEVSCCKNVHLPVYFYICLLTGSFWALEKRQLNKLRRQCADWTHNLYYRVWWNKFCFLPVMTGKYRTMNFRFLPPVQYYSSPCLWFSWLSCEFPLLIQDWSSTRVTQHSFHVHNAPCKDGMRAYSVLESDGSYYTLKTKAIHKSKNKPQFGWSLD